MQLRLLPGICGSLLPALILPAHIVIFWYFWHDYARYVDREQCNCSCWDTVFKGLCFANVHTTSICWDFVFRAGTYETDIASYKHMYFNATPNSFKIWILTVFGVIVMYESVKWLVSLIIQNTVRYSMIVLFVSSVYSHYYGWWAYINYYNDEFYSQWNHQLFFSVSVNQTNAIPICPIDSSFFTHR